MARPNIILILADDLGYGDLHCFGNEDVATPSIDYLAENGIRFTQNYSGSPVCNPSRAALMTGRYPHRTGSIDTLEGRGLDRLALREVTLGDVMKQAGYATGLIGKWHLGALDPRYHPNRRGFDEVVCFRGGWQDYYHWQLDYNGAYRAADGRYLTDVFSEEAVDFIRRHRAEPFFLHLTYNAPHFPLQAPEEEIEPYRNTNKFSEGVCRIYAMNRRMDRGIGRIIDELKTLKLLENTLIMFTSDNGPQFGGDGEMDTTRFNACFNGCKGLTYEGGIRVPAIVSWPAGLEQGKTFDEMIHFTDWPVTLAAAAGASFPENVKLDGRNVLPALQGKESLTDMPRFWQWNRYTPVGSCNAAMRNGKWKLIRPVIKEAMRVTREDLEVDRRLKYEPDQVTDITRDPEPQRTLPDPPEPLLFDLEADTYEQNDLAAANPQIARSMCERLAEWFDEVESERRTIEDKW